MEDKQHISLLANEAIELLQQLISIPSFSREEEGTAEAMEQFLAYQNIDFQHKRNNIWAVNKYFDPNKPTILLNSHHDTVKPNAGWTKNPFKPEIQDDKLFGLGSNDAGGCLVSLLAAFRYFYDRTDLSHNLIFAATAEEENSGAGGIESILDELGAIDLAIVGEPTQMQMAIAERGLLVLDCVAHGKTGHAAREEGDNAIYKALKDIEWFRSFKFPKVSEFLGPVKMTVTVVKAGEQHNVVPNECHFVVDIRLTDQYTHEEVIDIIRQHVQSEIKPRSTRLKPSFISPEHPIVQAGLALGLTTYGSPTSSDQAVIPYTSIKIGPGDSARSHTADEFIYLKEIEEGVGMYVRLLEGVTRNLLS